MIFFGKKASVIRQEHIFGISCPSCQTNNSIHGAVVGNYGHLYWIPTIPMGRTIAAQCEHCRKTFDEKDMPSQLRDAIRPMMDEVKTPLKHFSGLFVIGGLFVLGIYTSINNDRDNLAFINDPAIGDVYEIKDAIRDYTTQKVIAVTDDSVYCAENQYSVNKVRGLAGIDQEKNYINTGIGYSRQELIKMLNADKITRVKRN
ncbi:MAG: hypothetical protein J0M29_00535 [Chitinophagales bacterium]|nr:hypothetical protein [Chitinophagales bacterium]